MSDEHGDYEHTPAEVLQQDEAAPMRVEVVGPVVTQAAPGIDGDLTGVNVGAGGVEEVAAGDPRRSRLVLWADQPVRLSTSREGARNPNAALLPAGMPLTIHHRAPVFCRGTVDNTTVSASVERWAD